MLPYAGTSASPDACAPGIPPNVTPISAVMTATTRRKDRIGSSFALTNPSLRDTGKKALCLREGSEKFSDRAWDVHTSPDGADTPRGSPARTEAQAGEPRRSERPATP